MKARITCKANNAAQIAGERRDYNKTVLGLYETRWIQSGQDNPSWHVRPIAYSRLCDDHCSVYVKIKR